MPDPRSGRSEHSADQVIFAGLRKQGACVPASARLRLASVCVRPRGDRWGRFRKSVIDKTKPRSRAIATGSRPKHPSVESFRISAAICLA